MQIRFGGGRAVTVDLGPDDKFTVDNMQSGSSHGITFYESSYGGDEVTIFGTRKQLEGVAKKIYDELNRTEPQETTQHA